MLRPENQMRSANKTDLEDYTLLELQATHCAGVQSGTVHTACRCAVLYCTDCLAVCRGSDGKQCVINFHKIGLVNRMFVH